MNKISIQLEERDRQLARKEVKKRLKSFKKDPVWDVNKKSYGASAYNRGLRGVMGEIAFAKYADLTIDPKEYEKTDGGEDFYVVYQEDRCTIDVKTSNKVPYALMVKEGTVSADYYVQGHIDGLTVTFYGITTGEEVLSRELSETPYDHCNHEVPIAALDPIPKASALARVG